MAISRNRNTVFQVVWQVQQGCRSNCHGTTQSQTASQWSSTTQTATGIARGRELGSPGTSPGAAGAFNESVTVQFVWQLQIGCVAFCYETSQTQSASQWAETIQTAVAEAGHEAWAQNLSETLQYVWQIQEGCRHECHGVSQSQTVGQGQSTSQSSTAEAEIDTPVTTVVFGPDGVVVLPGWLVALAENHGATIQTLYQYQEAVCVEDCAGDVQLQEAIQEALTSQEAIAIAVVGPSDPEEPSASEPPPPPKPALPAPESPLPAPESPASEGALGQVRQEPRAASIEPAGVARRLPNELATNAPVRRGRLAVRRGSTETDSRSPAWALWPAGRGRAAGSEVAVDRTVFASASSTRAGRGGVRAAETGTESSALASATFDPGFRPLSAEGSSRWASIGLFIGALAMIALLGTLVGRLTRPHRAL